MDLTVFVFSLYFFLFFHVKYILHCKLLWLHVVYDAAAPVLCHCLVWEHSATVGLDACCDAHKQYVGIKRVLENIGSKLTHGIDLHPEPERLPTSSSLSCCLARALFARRVLRSLGLLAPSAHKLLQLFHSIFSSCRRFSAGCLPPKKKDQKGLLDLIYFLFWVSELG